MISKSALCKKVRNANSTNKPNRSDTATAIILNNKLPAPMKEFKALKDAIVNIKTSTDEPNGLNNKRSEKKPAKKAIHGEKKGIKRNKDNKKTT